MIATLPMRAQGVKARAALTIAVFLCSALPSAAQLQLATVTVLVLDASGNGVASAALALRDPLGAELASAVTDAGGRAMFVTVAPGRYSIRATVGATAPFVLPLIVEGALPVELTIRLPGMVSDTVRVEGTDANDASARVGVAGETLAQTPMRIRGRGLHDAIATLPGWSTEDNGLLHVRGVDEGILYVIDGVPVYERLDALSGIAPDLSGLASVSVISGYIPPEFGHKAGAVVDIRTASAEGADWLVDADLSAGSDAALDGSLSAGGRLRANASMRAGIVWSRSDRFLDPVHPDNLHNRGNQASIVGQFEWLPAVRDRVTAGWGYGRALFDVPNTADQEEAGQDQRQRNAHGYANVTWQRAWSANTVMQVAAYHRRSGARLDGSPFDIPLEARANRHLTRSGVLIAATRQHRAHLFKAGIEWQRLAMDEAFSFAITDKDQAEEAGFREEALNFTRSNPFEFSDRASPRMFSAFVQDAWQLASRVTLNGGIRIDSTRLLLPRSQVSPRVGVAARITDTTLLRAAVSRFFQPPQPENLLLSSSPQARVLSSIEVGEAEGGADVEPERQWAFEGGIEHQLGARLRLDAAYWRRWITDAADPNVFAGSTLIFPNAVAKGRAHGVEVRLEMPRRRQWSAYFNWSIARVVQTGPVTGGLFLEDEVEELGPGVEFAPDHDQRLSAGGGLTWTHAASRVALSLSGRYETGTPVQRDDDDDELGELPGAELVDFDIGRVRPRTVISLSGAAPLLTSERIKATLRLHVLNLFDARYAYNFGNPFSGTHFGAPRTVSVTIQTTFR
jgi:hypothetical protein